MNSLSLQAAVLIGSVLISLSVLVHGGIIKIGTPSAPAAPTAGPGQAAQPAKTEAQIIEGLKSQARSLGLDTNKFNSCLDSGEKATLVAADMAEGTAAGVNGTPASFINGRLISGAAPYADFQKIIDEELNGTTAAAVTRVEVGVGNLPMRGSASAKVTMVEFSDYECPFCERFFTQTEGTIKKDYVDSGKVKFYYRDFPLSSIHPGAQKAAEAARCAGDQNKYWEYHDLVFKNQSSIF